MQKTLIIELSEAKGALLSSKDCFNFLCSFGSFNRRCQYTIALCTKGWFLVSTNLLNIFEGGLYMSQIVSNVTGELEFIP